MLFGKSLERSVLVHAEDIFLTVVKKLLAESVSPSRYIHHRYIAVFYMYLDGSECISFHESAYPARSRGK